jgi:hypothetical protein
LGKALPRNLVEAGWIFDAIRENEESILSSIDLEDFRLIAEKVGIPSELTEQARLCVCKAAFVYRLVRDNDSSTEAGLSFSKFRKELSSLLSATQTLASRLDALSSDTRNLVEGAEEIVDYEMLASKPKSSFGHSFFRHWDREGHETRTYLHFPQILEAVSALREMIEWTLKSARPADKGGRPRRTQATQHFIENMREFWTKQLKRPFTFDQHMSEPTSEAAVFCWELLRFIDPNAKWSEFSTAMREAVRLDHPGRGRRRKSQKSPS